MENKLVHIIEDCRAEAAKRLVGQEKLIDDILTAFIAGGHVLLEGVPGLAKTLAIKTTAEILELKVSESSYKKIEEIIDEYKHQRERYGYNFIGLVVAISGKRLKRRKHFYCSEFVKDVLNRAEVENNLPKIPKPVDFREIKNTRLIYEGLLRNYNQA